MNVGIYNFKTIKLDKVLKMLRMLNFNNDDVFLYSENTNKEKIKYRKGLINIIEDYKSGIIDMIVFENIKSLGTNDYIICEVLKLLMYNKCRFICIYDRDFNYRNEKFLSIMIDIKERIKIEADERSKRGKIEKERMKL